MNTEAINTLKHVREGINAIQIEMNDETLKVNEKRLLAETLINLNRIEDIIINNALQDMVDKINSSNNQLKLLIVNMKASTERIARFSNIIKKISDTVGVLAEITSKAMSAGIL